MKTIVSMRWTVASFATGLLALGWLCVAAPACAASQTEVTRIIAEEAAKNGRVPLPVALAVAKVESDFRDDALSPAGARGVMQIMPNTAMSEFGVPAEALGDARLNTRLGIAYLERLHNRYGGNWELALSHYNGGTLPAAAGQYVAHDYTRQYVADVMKWAAVYRADPTMMALATPGPVPAVELAAAEPAPIPPPAPAAPTASPTVKTATARPAYPSLDELRARFRASLDRREASADPADTARAAAGEVAPPRRSRFSYAPYGG